MYIKRMAGHGADVSKSNFIPGDKIELRHNFYGTHFSDRRKASRGGKGEFLDFVWRSFWNKSVLALSSTPLLAL